MALVPNARDKDMQTFASVHRVFNNMSESPLPKLEQKNQKDSRTDDEKEGEEKDAELKASGREGSEDSEVLPVVEFPTNERQRSSLVMLRSIWKNLRDDANFKAYLVERIESLADSCKEWRVCPLSRFPSDTSFHCWQGSPATRFQFESLGYPCIYPDTSSRGIHKYYVDLSCVGQYHNEVYAKFTEHAPDRVLNLMELLIGIGAKPTDPESFHKIMHEVHQFLTCATRGIGGLFVHILTPMRCVWCSDDEGEWPVARQRRRLL